MSCSILSVNGYPPFSNVQHKRCSADNRVALWCSKRLTSIGHHTVWRPHHHLFCHHHPTHYTIHITQQHHPHEYHHQTVSVFQCLETDQVFYISSIGTTYSKKKFNYSINASQTNNKCYNIILNYLYCTTIIISSVQYNCSYIFVTKCSYDAISVEHKLIRPIATSLLPPFSCIALVNVLCITVFTVFCCNSNERSQIIFVIHKNLRYFLRFNQRFVTSQPPLVTSSERRNTKFSEYEPSTSSTLITSLHWNVRYVSFLYTITTILNQRSSNYALCNCGFLCCNRIKSYCTEQPSFFIRPLTKCSGRRQMSIQLTEVYAY